VGGNIVLLRLPAQRSEQRLHPMQRLVRELPFAALPHFLLTRLQVGPQALGMQQRTVWSIDHVRQVQIAHLLEGVPILRA
jgi:hypothetical protein